jgi:hypothetical protein
MDLKERRHVREVNRHPWEQSRATVVADILGGRLDAGSVVLDVGCGDLYLEERWQAMFPGARFYAVDTAFSPGDLANRDALPGTRLFRDLDDVERERPPRVDVVLLLDVIEHVEEPRAFLASLARRPYVTGETRFLVTVPAFPSLFTSHDRFLGHFRRYTRRRLRDELTAAGLSVHRDGYFYCSLLLPRSLQKAREWIAGEGRGATGIVEWRGGRRRAALARWLLTADYRAGKLLARAGIRLPGLSAYASCTVTRPGNT